MLQWWTAPIYGVVGAVALELLSARKVLSCASTLLPVAKTPHGFLHLSEMIHDSRICRARGPTKPSGEGVTGLRRPTVAKMLTMPHQVDPRRSESTLTEGAILQSRVIQSRGHRGPCLKVESVSIRLRVKPISVQRKKLLGFFWMILQKLRDLMSLTAKPLDESMPPKLHS